MRPLDTIENLPPCKKQRKNDAPTSLSAVTRKPRRSQMKLTLLSVMPRDIGFEIFGHLQPLDLLRLARTTKDMRSFLMHRSARTIWKRVLAAVDELPECPPDMSEPQYANLMFDPHCHYCLVEPSHIIVWLTRKRVCRLCFPAHHQRSINVRFDSKFAALPYQAWKFAELTGNIIHKSCFTPITRRDGLVKICNLELVKELLESFIMIPQGSAGLQDWLEQAERNYQRNLEITDALQKWFENRGNRRSEELAKVRQNRQNAIIGKLEASGWGEEIAHMNIRLLSEHKLVRVSRDLTDRVWTKIEPTMVAFMEGVKAERLEKLYLNTVRERRELFRKFLESSDLLAATPAVEASQLENIRSLIEDSPLENQLTQDSFRPFEPSLLAFSQSWTTSKEPDLLRLMLKTSVVPAGASAINLRLATSFFSCSEYDEPIHSQDVFIHPSLFRRNRWRLGAEPRRLFDDFKQETWNFGNRLSFHEPAFKATRAVLMACIPRVDPNSITAAEMDDWEPLLECLSCYDLFQGKLVMTWRQAVLHALKSPHHPTRPPRWNFVYVVDAHYAKAMIKIVAEPPQYRCHICHARGDGAFFNDHMVTYHPSDKILSIIPTHPASAVRVTT